MKKMLIGASLAALIAVPALALQQGDSGKHGGFDRVETRAEVEARVKERFAAADTNKDGAITRAEFDAGREKMKAERDQKRTERRDAKFAQLDTDKNGQISKAEFTAPRERAEGERGERGGRWHGRGGHHGGMGMGMMGGRGGGEWFERLDANKDGKVTLAEATTPALAMFDKADANKDGTVTPEERRAAWGAMREAWKAKRG